ncbi:Germination protease [Candidatus Hydrogenisulfobacillus filiaventi]|uniref:Germination protease n=1 Tax=Candidatus Hydrogenisulfobacillus filiaventi TaxID=2707344 RepID=A0A6F8ZGT0_9FIRM|nr:GPR endopeptidase [Bacillota bacterium]CAB1129150.1 Germination protease [Candidatus Hydrogenisulfobacillus filiaventi]
MAEAGSTGAGGRILTDMALEARELARGGRAEEIPGVEVVEESRQAGLIIHDIRIRTPEAGRMLGKPPGRYLTLDVPGFGERDPDLKQRLTAALAARLAEFLPPDVAMPVLVVGLGNGAVTPDALGPRVISRLLVTRHLGPVLPGEVHRRTRPVAALAPGVLGTTGVETVDIIRGVVQAVRPAMVVAVDALAARSPDRLVASVQLADTGIHPGSGVGNRRAGLTAAALGVPVLAVGVPTVVQAAAIASQVLRALARALGRENRFFALLGEFTEAERKGLVDEVAGQALGELMVTPKEIDLLIEDMAEVVAEALNRALQPRLDPAEWML